MKILKYLGIAILVLIALPLIAALFVSGDFQYEKSITINCPIDSVWQHTNTLEAMGTWGPWREKDPDMHAEMTGIDGTVGAKSCWESDVEGVGNGCQTISHIQAPTLMETDLKFIEPNYESEAKGYVKLEPNGSSTNVTWGFSSDMPYPFRIMKLFMDLDKEVGGDFTTGLNNLKEMCEAPRSI